jgi:integral membrane protein (TIGR00529 family)
MDALKLVLIFVAIVIALRRKISVGIVLLGAGLLMALLFQTGLRPLWQGYLDLVQSHNFILLTSVVVLITFLGALLKELHFLDTLSSAVQGLPGGRRVAVFLLPPLIGLMPMPGGSLLSAPLVGNVLSDGSYAPEFKVSANYWFRHFTEFIWPIYPGIILTEAVTGLPMARVSVMQMPLSALMIVIGLVMFTRRIKSNGGQAARLAPSLAGIVKSLWPIGLAIALYGLLKIDLTWAILIAAAALIVTVRPPRAAMMIATRTALSPKLILLVFGVLSFQMVIELSEAVGFIPDLAARYHFPEEVVVFLVCFTIGILTGMVSAYVGLGYALLAGFLCQPVPDPSLIMLAYLSGFVGVMMSPSHLCLILTNEYFGSDLMKVYKTLAIPISILMVLGAIITLTGWPDLFRLP